ncbi:chemotaxis-specific protein-glutamate methyltransferase CheB [Reichenbachiella carrageenanivorans]|uniref:Protein-glutamate methylesterase/protein-glutamine glutaminase n=1 Tax=Reichenbachiella carrageenanivorans TaxID=2979869 RepID=A0ABY6D327_9BACT|nr:chemotaxis-specific protein-glutamate methyltransferase CheB [Reichenbachiella carrageenanivorans]UXX79503.1 chemotaxis-specific protein-glutamate methyltransferase CheB [Reichenbachiella carrageenanivorans]
MTKTRILIADDSGFMRLLISDILSENEGMEVVGAAIDGKDALEKVKELKPDVLLLDMNMGEYDGIYAVKNIMKEAPLPILILSSVGNTNLQPIFDALQEGAVDYLNKPSRGNSKIRLIEDELIQKIRSVTRAKPMAVKAVTRNTNKHTFDGNSKYDLIVIGASTGGPSALEEIIVSLPSNLNVPVIIGQHMPTNFIAPFVKRLNKLSPLNVVVGAKNMEPMAGTVIIAPGSGNMVLAKKGKKIKLDFTEQQFREYNNPSINSIMLSAAVVHGAKTLGVILTGMGKDGVEGMKAIKEAGGYTIAQNEKSSVIYGMPKAAVQCGAIDKSIDIKEIGSFLVNSL